VENPRVHVTKQDGKLEEFVSQPKYCVTNNLLRIRTSSRVHNDISTA